MAQRKSKTRLPYDDDEIVLDMAKGELTQAQIAKKHRLTAMFVSQLLRGERRPELQARIDAACDGFLEQAKRLGKRLAPGAMARLGDLASADGKTPAEVKRKAAVDILRYSIGDPSRPEFNVVQHQQQQGPDLTALSPELKRKVIKDLDGPS